jgi:hypothetical protein
MVHALERTINRYYDPATDQFLSIDPDVATTDQPYVFTNDDPLNAEDPLGLDENTMGSDTDMWGDPGVVPAVSGGADEPENAAKAVKLSRQLASEQQVGEVGEPIAGRGSNIELRDAERLSNEYGGNWEDYSKMRSSSYQGSDGHQFETHWYENADGERLEIKIKVPDNSNIGYK